MSAATDAPTTAGVRSVLPVLAAQEIRRYLRHPLFWTGAALTALACLGSGPDARTSSMMSVIVPAAGLGLFGLLDMASLVRGSDLAAEAAGGAAVRQRTRTLALACAIVVPFSAALAWLAWALWIYHAYPPSSDGLPFPGVDSVWAYAVIVDLGVMAAIGGPVLRLVIARWVRFRGAAAVAIVVLVLVTITMQGIFEPLRLVRLAMPWTYFGGPFGVADDPERMVVLVGSPQWYGLYQLLLCIAGVLFAMYRDVESDRRRLCLALAAVVVLAIGAVVMAMTMGFPAELVNPIPSGLA